MAYKQITAKFRSSCATCGGLITPGIAIKYDPQVAKSARHVTCPAKSTGSRKSETAPILNSAPRSTPTMQVLSDEQAAAILAAAGVEFAHPLPGTPTLKIGDKITIDGNELDIGTCNTYVGIAVNWKGDKREHIVSLVDGTVLESAEYGKTKGIHYWTREIGAPMSLERQGRDSVKLGAFEEYKGHNYIVIQVDRPYYMSRDEAEDMDMFDRPGGYSTPFRIREITEPAEARERRLARERKVQEEADRKTAIKQAKQVFDAKIAELKAAGLVRTSCNYDLVEGDGRGPYLLEWKDGSDYRQLKQTTSKITGGIAYIFPHGGYDDYRLDMFVDAGTAHEAFSLQRTANERHAPQTKEHAEEWLKQYRGCAGTEYYEWLAKQESR